MVVFFNFWITDVLLQGRFWYYGYDVVKYFLLPR